jgi:hypothetical protein
MIISEEVLEAGKNKYGGWSREQLRLIGAADFKTLPDYYWKNRFMCADIDDRIVQTFLDLAEKDEGVYYELKTRDRRYSRFPNLMYEGSIAEAADINVPPIPAGWEEYREGRNAVFACAGVWEEYREEGELQMIRATKPITIIKTEGELLRYRNTAPFEKRTADPAYRSKSERLAWNYTHQKIRDAYFIPVDGIKQYLKSHLIQRFIDGFLDGDTFTGSGKLLVKPAYEEGGHLEYWRNGLLHRDNNQPAVISRNGKIKEWWFNGVFIGNEKEGEYNA